MQDVKCQQIRLLLNHLWKKVFNKHDISSIEKYLTEQGSKGFKQLSEFFTAFPERVPSFHLYVTLTPIILLFVFSNHHLQ